MTKRLCEDCRFFCGDICFRYPTPVDTGIFNFCGEWRDKNVTPEQEERRELVRRFAVALVGRGGLYGAEDLWDKAAIMANAEPEIQNLRGA